MVGDTQVVEITTCDDLHHRTVIERHVTLLSAMHVVAGVCFLPDYKAPALGVDVAVAQRAALGT